MTDLEILRINRGEMERQLQENGEQTAKLREKRNIMFNTLEQIDENIARLNNRVTQTNPKG